MQIKITKNLFKSSNFLKNLHLEVNYCKHYIYIKLINMIHFYQWSYCYFFVTDHYIVIFFVNDHYIVIFLSMIIILLFFVNDHYIVNFFVNDHYIVIF